PPAASTMTAAGRSAVTCAPRLCSPAWLRSRTSSFKGSRAAGLPHRGLRVVRPCVHRVEAHSVEVHSVVVHSVAHLRHVHSRIGRTGTETAADRHARRPCEAGTDGVSTGGVRQDVPFPASRIRDRSVPTLWCFWTRTIRLSNQRNDTPER